MSAAAKGVARKTTTDERGRFSLDVPPAQPYLTVERAGYEPYILQLQAVAIDVENLSIPLNHRLYVIDHYGPRSRCSAFQPQQVVVRYELVPGQCGIPKLPRN